MAGARTHSGKARGRPRSADTDRLILDAALKLLSERGYARMSMDAVASEAGVSKPTIYLRYPGKADLAAAALAAYDSSAAPEPTGDVRADLLAQLRHFRRSVERPFGLTMIGNLLAEEQQTPALLEGFRTRTVGPRRRQLRGILERAVADGRMRQDADLDAAVNMLIGSYYAQYLSGDPFPLRWPEHQVDLVLAGLAHETAEGGPERAPAGGMWEGMRAGKRVTPARRGDRAKSRRRTG